MTAHLFQGDETFGSVVPFDGELIADGLNIERAH
jgi:hypothetical protein